MPNANALVKDVRDSATPSQFEKYIIGLIETSILKVQNSYLEKRLSPQEVGEIFNIHQKQVVSMVKDGILPEPIRIGRREIAWPEGQILRWAISNLMESRDGIVADHSKMSRRQVLTFLRISSSTFWRIRKNEAFVKPVNKSYEHPLWERVEVEQWLANGGFENWEKIKKSNRK